MLVVDMIATAVLLPTSGLIAVLLLVVAALLVAAVAMVVVAVAMVRLLSMLLLRVLVQCRAVRAGTQQLQEMLQCWHKN